MLIFNRSLDRHFNHIDWCRSNIWLILLLTVDFILPFFWLQGRPIATGDSGLTAFFYNSDYLYTNFKYIWKTWILTGYPSGSDFVELPMFMLSAVLSSIGINNYLQQALSYSFLLSMSTLFFYAFMLEFFEDIKNRSLIAFIGAFFYTFNPLTMVAYWYTRFLSIYLLAYMPIMLYLTIMAFKKNKFYYFLLMSVSTSLFSITFLNFAFALPILLLLFLFMIFFTIAYTNSSCDRLHSIKNILYSLVVCLLGNMWFLLPFASSISDSYASAINAIDPNGTLMNIGSVSSLDTFFRLIIRDLNVGSLALNGPTWSYITYYDCLSFLGISAFILILFGILQRRTISTTFLAAILAIGLFLCNGSNPPFGHIFLYMFDNIPFFQAFRNPSEKFLPILLVPCSVLFAVGVVSLYEIFSHKMGRLYAKLLIALIIFLVCVIYTYPMWTGSVMNNPTIISNPSISQEKVISHFVEIPYYYKDISQYFQNDATSYRVLSLPLRPLDHVTQSWTYGYEGGDYTHLLYKHDTISALHFCYRNDSKILYTLMKNPSKNIDEICGLFNVKYIVIQNDIDPIYGRYAGTPLLSSLEIKALLLQSGFFFLGSFGKLDLYEVSWKNFTPRIYAVSSHDYFKNFNSIISRINSNQDIFKKDSIILYGDESDLDHDAATEQTEPIYFVENPRSFPHIPRSGMLPAHEKYVLGDCIHKCSAEHNFNISDRQLRNPSLTFKRINPTKYAIHIESTQPFFLVFSESYHLQWKLFIDNSTTSIESIIDYKNTNVKEGLFDLRFNPRDISYTFMTPINDKTHFIANGYANAWYINKTGSYDIILYFLPQNYFYIGLFITLTSVGICLIYIFYIMIRTYL